MKTQFHQDALALPSISSQFSRKYKERAKSIFLKSQIRFSCNVLTVPPTLFIFYALVCAHFSTAFQYSYALSRDRLLTLHFLITTETRDLRSENAENAFSIRNLVWRLSHPIYPIAPPHNHRRLNNAKAHTGTCPFFHSPYVVSTTGVPPRIQDSNLAREAHLSLLAPALSQVFNAGSLWTIAQT